MRAPQDGATPTSGKHIRHSHRERAAFALRHPGLAWRIVTRQDATRITAGEIAPYLPGDPVILEAGACDGTDTARFAQQWPGAVIHAFEPIPALQDEVRSRTAHLPGVRLYPLALSGQAGRVTMHVHDPGPGGNRGTSSLLPHPSPRAWETEVQAVTIAGWAAAEGVDRIDLMWLDMEGVELAALKAAGPVLDTVKAVCMEVSREPYRPDSPLYGEVVAWMREHGFRVAIDRVTLWFGNILFVRR
jgi:FkbM family methyltransferase